MGVESKEAYIVEFSTVEAAAGLRDREQLYGDTQVIQISGSDSCRVLHVFGMSVGIVIVGDEKEAARNEVGCPGREDLVCCEEHVRHGHLLIGWEQKIPRDLFVLDQGSDALDVCCCRNIEVRKEVAVRVGEAAGAAATGSVVVVILELGLSGAEEQDAHHVFGVGDDALLHELVGALERCQGGAVRTRVFRRILRLMLLQHGAADIDGEEHSVLDGLVGLAEG